MPFSEIEFIFLVLYVVFVLLLFFFTRKFLRRLYEIETLVRTINLKPQEPIPQKYEQKVKEEIEKTNHLTEYQKEVEVLLSDLLNEIKELREKHEQPKDT